jgi:hypothetical protein
MLALLLHSQRGKDSNPQVLRCEDCKSTFAPTPVLSAAVERAFRRRGLSANDAGLVGSAAARVGVVEESRSNDERIRSLKWALQLDRRDGEQSFPSDLNALRVAFHSNLHSARHRDTCFKRATSNGKESCRARCPHKTSDSAETKILLGMKLAAIALRGYVLLTRLCAADCL